MPTTDKYAPAPLAVEPIFERQPGETDQAWEAFVMYRDGGSDRSLTKVAQTVGKERTLMGTWSSRWSWVKRSQAWDKHLDDVRRKSMEKAAATMAERHANQAMLVQNVLQRPLAALAKHLQGDPKALDKMTAKELFALVRDTSGPWKTAIDVERLSRGADTERVSHAGLTVEDFRAAAAMSIRTAAQSASPENAPAEPAEEDKGPTEPDPAPVVQDAPEPITGPVLRPMVTRRNPKPRPVDPNAPPATA